MKSTSTVFAWCHYRLESRIECPIIPPIAASALRRGVLKVNTALVESHYLQGSKPLADPDRRCEDVYKVPLDPVKSETWCKEKPICQAE